jgi:hypothetical protein
MTIEKQDYEFLLLSSRFCNKIDNYISLFNISDQELDELKEDTLQLVYFLINPGHHSTSAEHFTNHKLRNMRIAFSHLTQLCRSSKNYTVQIGLELGIEFPVYAFRLN